jgi:hypothetical protein
MTEPSRRLLHSRAMRPFLLGLLVSTSCAPPLPIEGAACPCAEGWVCCEGSNVCVTGFARCPLVPGPTVEPSTAEVGVDRRFRFSSTSTDVRWAVEEGDVGGTFEAPGVYVAPSRPGTYHVLASANGGTTRVPVVVRPLRLQVLAGDYGGPSFRPIDGVGPLARVVNPRDGVIVSGAYYFLDGARPDVLRRLTLATGLVETLFEGADTGAPPLVDGPQGTARFVYPKLLTASPTGEVVVADQGCLRALRTTDLSVRTLVCPMTTISGLAASATHLYWTNLTELRRWNRTSGVIDVVVPAASLSKPGRLALADEALYFLDQDGAAVRSVDLPTGAVFDRLAPEVGRRFVDLDAWRSPGEPPTFVVLTSDGRLNGTSGFYSDTSIGAHSLALDVESSTQELLLATPDSIRRLNRGLLQEVLAGRPSTGAPIQLDGRQASARFVFQVPSPYGVLLASRGEEVWVAEPIAGTIRTIDRRGEVTTRFTGVEASSMAVDDTYLYVTTPLVTYPSTKPPRLQRAPRLGGAWEVLPVSLSEFPFMLLGVLEDGRVAYFEGSGVRFLDGTTGARRPERVSVPPPYPQWQTSFVLDPAGALWMGDARIDLATGRLSRASGSVRGVWQSHRAFGRGRLWAAVSFADSDPASALYRDEAGAFDRTPFLGLPEAPMVLPGPLDTARLHSVGAMTVLWNGDLVIADAAENVVLVVE